MKSRLLARVEQDLQAAQAAGQRLPALLLRAQRALLLIRQGELVERPRRTHRRCTSWPFASPHPELAAWLHLAEGLIGYLNDLGTQATEHFQKAQALARAGGAKAAEAQAYRYLTNMAYYRHDLPALVRHAQAGLAMPVDTDPVAHAGIHLWVALSHLYAGDAAASRPWQLACRSARHPRGRRRDRGFASSTTPPSCAWPTCATPNWAMATRPRCRLCWPA